MTNPLKLILTSVLLFCSIPDSSAQKSDVDWEKFMKGQDLTYNNLSTNWHEGAFTGNGLLGTMLYKEDEYTLRLDIGRTDIYDHQSGNIDKLFGKARLPVGYFRIRPTGNIQSIRSRTDLWNAEVRSLISTDRGEIRLRILTTATQELILVETNASGGETGFLWEWHPEKSISPRTGFRDVPAGYQANPDPVISREKEVSYCHQPMTAGGSYTTAWKEEKATLEKRNFYITVHYSPTDNNFQDWTNRQFQNTRNENIPRMVREHRNWWHNYYPQSFMTMPDARMESFYWIQQYKLASATRQGKPAIDLQGPWTRYTPWPGYWMNLNIQLTYSPLYTANRLDLASTLTDFIDNHSGNLNNNVPEKYRYNSSAIGRTTAPDLISPVSVTKENTNTLENSEAEVGNLTWTLYYYWQYYRYSMNKKVLDKLYHLLKRSINYYIHLLDKNENGKWVIVPETYSPEYPGGMGHNTNYDLSLLRWGVNTLLKINREENHNDPLAGIWQDISDNLIDYPQDKTGLLIAENMPYTQSHRHYSHMLMIYPLYEMNWDQPENRDLIERSLNHWQSMPGALQGYSFTGKASICAMMGKGNETRNTLKVLLDKFVKPNTMYLESGPVIETPLAAVTSMQEMYLQNWNNTVRVFPAVPDDWENAAFENFRTEGAFLISAARSKGKTQWIKIKSTAGGDLRMKPGLEGKVEFKSNRKGIVLGTSGDGIYICHMPQGSEITLYTDANALDIPVRPVKLSPDAINSFGLK